MSVATKTAFKNATYIGLLAKYPPRPITNLEQNRKALNFTATLMKKENRTPEENTLLELYGMLIDNYESARYANAFVDDSTPAEILASLMQENGIGQKDFAPAIPQSRISDILSGKRKITLAQAKVFSERFKLNVSIFLK